MKQNNREKPELEVFSENETYEVKHFVSGKIINPTEPEFHQRYFPIFLVPAPQKVAVNSGKIMLATVQQRI